MPEDKQVYVVEQPGNLPAPVATNAQWAARRAQFNEFVNTQLHSGVDFGVIPGTGKPTMLKPGAEKVLQMFGCAVVLEVAKEQDPNTGYLNIEVTAKAISIMTGVVVGMGVGSCSSWESKYRYRWESWHGKGQPPAVDGWESAYNKTSESTYYRRRVENKDLIDQWNTVLKMAKKRAIVDLALTISGASEKFTQDVEDFADQESAAQVESEPTPKATQSPAPPADGGNGHDTAPAATGTQTRGDILNELDTRLKRITELDSKTYPKMWWTGHMKKHYGGLTSASALSDVQVLDYIAHCDGLIAKLSATAPATVDDHRLPANL